MTGPKSKFMVQLLHGLGTKQVFFIIWFAIVAIFVLLIMAYYRRNTRRNFRRPEDGPGPRIDVLSRKLGSGDGPRRGALKDPQGSKLTKG